MKAEKRQRDQQRKQKISENRKHLANVRVVQKNLVFVVGLPPRLADAEVSLFDARAQCIKCSYNFAYYNYSDSKEARVLWEVWQNS